MSTTQEKIAVMQAHADGKVVEFLRHDIPDTWAKVSHPQWDWSMYEYRVQPAPLKVIYVVNSTDQFSSQFSGYAYENRPSAERAFGDKRTITKYIEVRE